MPQLSADKSRPFDTRAQAERPAGALLPPFPGQPLVQPQALETFDPYQLAVETHDAFVYAAARGVLLVFELRELPPRITGDLRRIRDLLFTLVGNAVNLTAKGEVRVEFAISGCADRPHLRLDVKDTGVGIDGPTLANLFQCFGPREAGARRDRIGLGLAICKQLADFMNGEIGATSVAGRGSHIWVRLPVISAAQ